MQNYLPACKIVATHGVRGEMRALPLCDGAAFLAKFKRLYATPDGGGETALLGVRAQGNVLLLRLAGVSELWCKQRRDAIIIWCVNNGYDRAAVDHELIRFNEKPLLLKSTS